MESSLFDELNKTPDGFDAFFDSNVDSITDFFDLNQLDSLESNFKLNSNPEFLVHGLSSPSDSSSSDNNINTNNSNTSSPDSPGSSNSNSTSDFNFLDEPQQAILALEASPSQRDANVEPISFFLPPTVENGMQITNEIILNFDQMDEATMYEQYELLSKLDLTQQLNVVSMDNTDTRIELNENESMSDE